MSLVFGEGLQFTVRAKSPIDCKGEGDLKSIQENGLILLVLGGGLGV